MVKFEKIMRKIVIFMILAAYVMVVGVVGWSLAGSDIKEATVEAEVVDILSVQRNHSMRANWITCKAIYRYTYKGKEYEKKVNAVASIRSYSKGEKVRVVIDSEHPDTLIRFTKKVKIIFLSVMLGIMVVFAVVMGRESYRSKKGKNRKS